MTTITALSSVNDILDTDLIMITHSTGDSYKMTGADLKAKIQAVTAPVDEVTSGNMHSVTSNAVYTSLHNSNDVFQGNQGNFIMPNGLIIKCGVCTGGHSNNDDWNVNFSTAFPNGLFQVFVTPNSGSATCPSGWYTVTRTSSGFKIFCNGNAPNNGFAWLAIGA